MNPFTVRSLSLGLGAALMTLSPLPVLANNPALNVEPASRTQPGIAPVATETPQLLAVALAARNLQIGDEGADVRVLQRYLSRNGLYPFMIDGVYGQETANSVATYQRIRDLPATGIADEATLRDMEFDFLPAAQANNSAIPLPPSSSPSSIQAGSLGPGSSGTDVIVLQQRLNDFGFPVFVDGVYGFETQQAVRTYQRVQGLNVTGTADPDTLSAIGISGASSASSENRYVAAVIADSNQLANVRQFFEDAYIDRDRRGEFINIGNFATRFPAEAKVNAAIARGFNTRVIYRQRNFLF
ncbi:MAG: peptidoglycan-binding protein [Phormidesmis sp.]